MRGRKQNKRELIPDLRYHSQLVTRFINMVMERGKKSVAEKIVYGAIEDKNVGIEVFHKAIENVSPFVEVKSRRVGGATYQVPVEPSSDRRQALAIRWLIESAAGRSGKTMREKLMQELIDASHSRGGAMKKREDVHRMAEANKAFAHYR